MSYDSLPSEVEALKDQVAKLTLIVQNLPSGNIDPYKDTSEAAAYIKKTPNAVRILVHNNAIPCIKRGKKLYFHIDDLNKWMEDGRRGKKVRVLK
ncbi:MAG TPA: helix-turn-helix domain-containing protein [Sphingobacteriaceae bacterium]